MAGHDNSKSTFRRDQHGPTHFAALPLLLLAAGLLLLSAVAGAQDEPASFDDVTDVVEVQVPVNVVTKSGEPVANLRLEDFRILDEGQEQKLIAFDVIDLGKLDEQAANERIKDMPSVARRHFLLLFDFTWSTAPSIVKARRAAHDFVLSQLHPTDLVAIATFSLEFGPRLLVTFTPDRAQLARAIDTLGLTRKPGSAGERVDPLRFMIEPPRDIAPGGGNAGSFAKGDLRETFRAAELENARAIGKQMHRADLNYQRSRVSSWSRGLADLGTALNAVAGRKHVIYFSEGFNSELLLGKRPVAAGQEYNQDMVDRIQGQLWMVNADETFGSSGLQRDIDKMLEAFRRSDVIVQAVDIAGLRAEISGGESPHARGLGSDGLFYMANETGGELFEASNNLGRQLDAVLDRSQVTYVLSFQPSKLSGDGKYHRLKVTVQGMKGTRVSARAGYYEPRPFADLHPLEKGLLASEAIASAAPSEEIGISVLAAPFRANEALAYLPVIIEIEGDDLLRMHTEEDRLDVEIYAYVTNAQGEMRDYFSQNAQFDIRRFGEKILESGVKYYGTMELPPGEYLLRVLVRNGNNGRTGVRATSISIPEYKQAQTTVLPPFFMDHPADKWLLLRERGEVQTETVIYPFIVNGETFVPTARPSLRRSERVEFCLMTYNLSEGEVQIEGWVVNADGDTQQGDLRLVERTVTGISGLDKMLASFAAPSDLPLGDYTLEVAVVDPATGSRQLGSIPFQVDN